MIANKRQVSVLIVDDEAPARNKLKRYLAKHPSLSLLGEASDGQQALDLIEQHRPDLLLLDIQMPGMTGFDVLRLLPEQYTAAVIFTTAYDEYAIKAFEISALDYLLKPFGQQRFDQAINKYLNSRSSLDFSDFLHKLPNTPLLSKIPLRANKRIKLIALNDILYFHSEHRLVNCYTADDQRLWTNESLDLLQKRLQPHRFFRVHRSSLINLDAEFEVETWTDGRLKLHFNNQQSLTVAREPAKLLRQYLRI